MITCEAGVFKSYLNHCRECKQPFEPLAHNQRFCQGKVCRRLHLRKIHLRYIQKKKKTEEFQL